MNQRWIQDRIAVMEKANASEKLLLHMAWFNKPDAFGMEQGQLRPNELGKWDLFYFLSSDMGHSRINAAAAVGLDLAEIDKEEARDELRRDGVDPDNLAEVAASQRLDAMTPEELDAEIERLEKLLLECTS